MIVSDADSHDLLGSTYILIFTLGTEANHKKPVMMSWYCSWDGTFWVQVLPLHHLPW